MLIVKPVGGLANRMRVIAASIQLAEEVGTKVKFIWESNAELGANFQDLFKESKKIQLCGPIKGKLVSSLKRSSLKRFLVCVWNKFHGIDYFFSSSNIERINSGANGESPDYHAFFNLIRPLLLKDSDIYFVSGNYLADLRDVSMFQPVEELERSIAEYASEFDEHTFGLHIRRTDNIWSIESSPIELFYEKIGVIVQNDQRARFYLATDDRDTVEQLRSRFGNSIIVREKKYGRDSLDAMKDAVVDMWLLSKTQHIYGSFYSSFSEMAAWIGDVKLETIKK